jgi:hypothetical protein
MNQFYASLLKILLMYILAAVTVTACAGLLGTATDDHISQGSDAISDAGSVHKSDDQHTDERRSHLFARGPMYRIH